MAKIARLIAALAPLALATIAIAFAIQATLDKDWAQRDIFNGGGTDSEFDWTAAFVNTTEYRSPFILCGYVQNNLTLSRMDQDNTYTYTCKRYAAYGQGNTSCESLNVTGSRLDARYGDQRLCQQIHWTGNVSSLPFSSQPLVL